MLDISKIYKTISKALALLIVFILSSCFRNTAKEIHEVEEEQERASFIVQDLHTTITDSGYVKYDFETPELEQYDNVEDPYIDFPVGLKFKMYSEHGQTLKTTVRCNNARFFKDRNLWELNNDVEAVTQKGEILNTEQLFWDTKNHNIYSEKFVKISTQSQLITGYGFESDEKMSKYEIKRPGGEIEIKNAQQ